MFSINKKILFRFLWFFVILGILAFLVFNQNGIIKFISLRQGLNNLNAQIKNAEDKINSLEMEIDSLNKSKEKIEKVAREKFHMMRPNERVLKIEEN
ncbi:MAG: septum formation initiator family protein [Melioribacter sp.]|nr:septum formation initiator family protein [Melioribacter sp.]